MDILGISGPEDGFLQLDSVPNCTRADIDLYYIKLNSLNWKDMEFCEEMEEC